MTKSRLFLSGVPTAPDVERLMTLTLAATLVSASLKRVALTMTGSRSAFWAWAGARKATESAAASGVIRGFMILPFPAGVPACRND